MSVWRQEFRVPSEEEKPDEARDSTSQSETGARAIDRPSMRLLGMERWPEPVFPDALLADDRI
eukprot:CAMPEP_0170629134 /NCGR_PEP_ID=MMETSP0224-20130122/33141_1 /TAXON_ID=285029 /ORGANISM="Togula jolla, Strain CCCM 725" /LENGTH=62 /DNA_ID=CAMNT_0010956777 /DNA_START=110 /DNA_END=299 /DNA_ORIENTATION=-